MSRDAVTSLLAELQRKDVHLELRGDRIHVDAPKGALSDTDRAALKSSREELRSRLEFEADLLGMSFREFSRTQFAVELAVPWMQMHVWLIPDVQYVDQLLDQGVARGCIWTAGELIDLYEVEQFEEEDRRVMAILRAHFNTQVLSIEDWSECNGKAIR